MSVMRTTAGARVAAAGLGAATAAPAVASPPGAAAPAGGGWAAGAGAGAGPPQATSATATSPAQIGVLMCAIAPPQGRGGRGVDGQRRRIEHHAVLLARGRQGDVAFRHVALYLVRRPRERIAVAAAPAGLHDVGVAGAQLERAHL